jgi:hypothetical protein
MYRAIINRSFLGRIALLAGLLIPAAWGFARYIPTNRDTKPPPPALEYLPAEDGEFTFLTSAGPFEYYYREDRDILMVKDQRNGYAWKTGLDIPFNADIDRAVNAAKTSEERIAAAMPKEERLNATYTGFANSLLTVELYDDAFNIQLVSSASRQGASSKLALIEQNHYRLDAEFPGSDLKVKVHIFFTGEGISYRVYDEEIEGTGAQRMAAVILTPFLGASGGVQQFYDPVKKQYDERRAKPPVPGYVFVPDGSGALIRFENNTVALQKYSGSVYGVNPAETMYYYSSDVYAAAKKEPLMPVFGIAHGADQAAFAAWAESGAEHLEITVSPEENMTYYTFAYPRFVYNRQIHQVYNRKGEGYFRLYPERFHFDIEMTYRFLAGNGEDSGGLSADYVGMARAYRERLIKRGILREGRVQADGKMPVRVDFVMSDIKKSIIGMTNVVLTTAGEAAEILSDLLDSGVAPINSGLLGFQNGGITGGKPWALDFTRSIGGAGAFSALFSKMREQGVDVSFAQDYARINKLQMALPRNQAYHVNHWGLRAAVSEQSFVPVQEISYARPEKSAEWFKAQAEKAGNLGAQTMTISGISNLLLSHYGDRPIDREGAAALYAETLDQIEMNIDAETPNEYLWKYIDRFLQTPVLNTQYILETDTVPFLQLVLNGTMELYSPYANFSFYTQEDILQMIDYNVYPSFVISSGPAYLLSDTNSLTYYSTEYRLYRDIIQRVWESVSPVLSQVKGKEWIDRQVLENGVILNTYRGGIKILINYTNDTYRYGDAAASGKTAYVFRGD